VAKISQRSTAGTVQGANVLGLIQDGLDKQITVTNLMAAASSGTQIFRNPADYGLVDDATLLVDQTTALQNYLNAYGTGTAHLPNWRIAFTQVKLRPGTTLIGAGIGPGASGSTNYGTYLRQLNGSNVDAIINDPASAAPGSWHHWTRLSGFRLEKAVGHTDTLGSGIKFSTSPGEGMIIDWVFIARFPENGIWLADGAVPLKMRDLHLFLNGEYGLKLGTSTTKLWSGMYIETVSGDQNGLGLIHLHKLQSTNSTLLINHIKAESPTVAGTQDCTIHIEDCLTPIEIHCIGMLGITPKVNEKIMVKITGTNTPTVAVYGMDGSLVDTMIKDLQNNITIPWDADRTSIVYKDGVIHDLVSDDAGPVLGIARVASANAQDIAYVVPVLVNGKQIGAMPIYTTPSQPADSLFADGFETGTFSAWTTTINNAGGSIAVSASAALAGSFGALVTPSAANNVNANVVRKVVKWRTPYLGGKITLNLNTWSSPSTRQCRIWKIMAADSSPVLFECYIDTGLASKTCTLRCSDDTNAFVRTSSFIIDTATHTIEFFIQRASSATANDGIFRTWLDGVMEDEFTNVDLYDQEFPDTLEVGSNPGYTLFTGSFFIDGVVLSDIGRAL
jgi:hypothetical protein